MKKNILSAAFLLGFFVIEAQNIEFRTDSLGASVNGQTLTKTGSPSDFELIEHIFVIQKSGSDMDIRAKSYELSVANGIKHTLCWYACYIPLSPGVQNPFISPDVLTIASDTVRSNFSAHYYPNGVVGISKFRYVLYDDNNPSDSAYVDVIFDTDPTSVKDYAASDITLSTYPNPATDQLTVEYVVKENAANLSLSVYDVLGQEVISKNLNTNKGTTTLNLKTMRSGIYFYAIKVAEKTVRTEKFIVR